MRTLRPLSPLPAIFWDERLSTAAVTRTLLEADTSRKRRGEVVDKMAASFILQGFLDRLHATERLDDPRRRPLAAQDDDADGTSSIE